MVPCRKGKYIFPLLINFYQIIFSKKHIIIFEMSVHFYVFMQKPALGNVNFLANIQDRYIVNIPQTNEYSVYDLLVPSVYL